MENLGSRALTCEVRAAAMPSDNAVRSLVVIFKCPPWKMDGVKSYVANLGSGIPRTPGWSAKTAPASG